MHGWSACAHQPVLEVRVLLLLLPRLYHIKCRTEKWRRGGGSGGGEWKQQHPMAERETCSRASRVACGWGRERAVACCCWPEPKGQAGAAATATGGVGVLLQTSVRRTMVGVQAHVRLGAQKVDKRNGNYRAAGERGGGGG